MNRQRLEDQRPTWRSRRWTLVALAVPGALAFASAAWACAPIQGFPERPGELPPGPEVKGQLRICPVVVTPTEPCADTASGAEGRASTGSTVKVWGYGLHPEPARYSLFYNTPAEMASQLDCSTATEVMQAPQGSRLDAMTTNRKGELDRDRTKIGDQPYKGVLPDVGSVPGEFEIGICARQNESPNQSRSTRAVFNVVVV